MKANDYSIARFYNITLNGDSKVWKNIFLSDKFFEYIIHSNNYSSERVDMLEKNIAKDVEDYIANYISRRVDSKKLN